MMMVHNVSATAFLSTLSLRRATSPSSAFMHCLTHFYPRSPCGERPDADGGSWVFNTQHFYPRSPCGERPKNETLELYLERISIHALLAESDCSAGVGFC